MNDIHVALTFDDNYTQHSVVLMTSILANKGDENIIFHIIDGGISETSRQEIAKLQNCIVNFHSVDKGIFKSYKKIDYYPINMLYTMILPDLINTEKLIYLDSDMVVNSSLTELWNIPLDDNYIAAVEDCNGAKYAQRYKLNAQSKFFNTGTMLINCDKWRKDDIPRRAVEISMQNAGEKEGLDQTVLNKLFDGKVKFIDLKWNLQYCPINIWASYSDKKEYREAIESPNIVHFVGDYKPWIQGLGCFNPKQDDYFKYHKMTSYALSDYGRWLSKDRHLFFKGLFTLIKRYPLFFARKAFWQNFLFNCNIA